MAALTIRHDGIVATGQTIVGQGRRGSVGVHVPPGLGLVVIDGFTVRGFDIGILAESPVVVVNSEFLDYITAGVALSAGENHVEFCSFLDQRDGRDAGSCILAGRSASSVKVANNAFHVFSKGRYFGLGYRVEWESLNNIGLAPDEFARTGNGQVWSPSGIVPASMGGVVRASPGFARTEPGHEVMLLLHSSDAIRSVRGTLLPPIEGQRFDQHSRLPRVDRKSNKRAVEFLSAGAHEMSFAITAEARVRMLELLAGLSRDAFVSAASGRNGTFSRLPGTNSNPTAVVVEDPRDIQPSTDMAVMSFSDHLFGGSSAYFKPERRGLVPFLLSAAPSRESNMHDASAISVMAWTKSLSANADILLWRGGEGVAQDREVVSVRQRFQGAMRPNLRLKLRLEASAHDYAFVVEDAEAIETIAGAIATDEWVFTGWSFDGLRARYFCGKRGDSFLRSYPARAYVVDPVAETMVPAQGSTALTVPRRILDPNDSPVCVGSNSSREDGWHGFVDELRVDIGEALGREEMEAEFLSGVPFGHRTRLSRQIPQTDMVIGRERGILLRAPGTPAGDYPGSEDVFAFVRKVVHGDGFLAVCGRRSGGDREGVYLVRDRVVSTVIDNIPEVYDIAIDRSGNLVILASDMPISRIDLGDGERRELTLDLEPMYSFRSIAISGNGQYVVGDFGDDGGRLVLVDAPRDVASNESATSETIPTGGLQVSRPVSIAVTDNDEIYVLDSDGPAISRIETWRLFETQIGLGVDQPVPAGQELVVPGVDLPAIGVLPGDRLAFVSSDEGLVTPFGQAVAQHEAPENDNAGEFLITSVSGSRVGLDRPLVAETAIAGKQFEMRLYRRNGTAVVVHRGAPLENPKCIAFNPGDPSRPILVADPSARRSDLDTSEGVIFSVGRDGTVAAAHYRANLGYDLSTVTSLLFRPNDTVPPITVAGALRSRMAWHMEIDQKARGTIRNAAFPGLSDLAVPHTTLNELLLIQDAQVAVERDRDDAVLRFETVFGTDPRLEKDWLNNEYENLSELGVITRDGVVLLGRQAIVKTPYDPLSPVMTLWRQGVRISP